MVLQQKERDTILTMPTILCWPHKRMVHLAMFKVSVCRDQKNPTTSSMVQIQLDSLPQWQKLNFLSPWPNLNSQLTLFQNPQILRTISSGHDIIHTPVPFPSWGFIMTMVIVISFVHEHKLYQLTIYPNSKLNSSKPNQTEW